MSIYKRKETWWIKFTMPDGRRIQQSAGTKIKHEVQELHDRLKSEAWRVGKLGDKPRYTWQEAVTRWLQEQSHKRSIDDDKHHLVAFTSLRLGTRCDYQNESGRGETGKNGNACVEWHS